MIDIPPSYRSTYPRGAHNAMSHLYNVMIYPLGPLKISGVAWYQGEQNVPKSDRYGFLLIQLFKSWRRQFLDPALNFHVVQLANYSPVKPMLPGKPAVGDDATGWAGLRYAQYQATEFGPHTWMVTAMGTVTSAEALAYQIHPVNKKTVGQRLARSAMAFNYGGKPTQPEWRYRSIRSTADGRVLVPAYFPPGLTLPALNTPIRGFALQSSGRARTYSTQALVKFVDAVGRLV